MKTPYRTLHSELRPYTQALRERQQEREAAGRCIDCGAFGASSETLLCEPCFLNTLYGVENVIDLDDERETRELERLFGGDEG